MSVKYNVVERGNPIPDEISRGNIVKLGDFGSFWVKLKTEAGETPEAVSQPRFER